MAENVPEIPPVKGDGIVNEAIQKDPEKGNSNADNAGKDESDKDKSGQDAKTIEQVEKERDEQITKLTEAWKEDREFFQGQIKDLRAEAKNPKLTQREEDELEGLEENERVEKIIEFREKRKKAADEAELKAVKSEIRFFERTDKEFAENKKDILKVAEDYDCPSLKQAILMWRGLNAGKVKKDTEYHDNRKKNADGKGGGNAGGTTAGKPYDPKTDGKKSFGDFYREAGL